LEKIQIKQGTNKMPIQPRIDHDQRKNIFLKLFEKIFSGSSPLLGEWKPSKHGDSKRCQNSTNYIRKMRAKKKRLRKIKKRTQRHCYWPNKPMIKV